MYRGNASALYLLVATVYISTECLLRTGRVTKPDTISLALARLEWNLSAYVRSSQRSLPRGFGKHATYDSGFYNPRVNQPMPASDWLINNTAISTVSVNTAVYSCSSR